MDWRLLGYAVEEPWKERSKNQQDKFNKKVVADASIFLTRTFAPQMQTEIRNMIGQDVSVCMDPNDKEQCSFVKRCFCK